MTAGVSVAGAVADAGASMPSWLATESDPARLAAMIVRVIEVAIKQAARTQVILPSAVAAARPEIAPPPPPLPIPKPPPSERCNKTTPIIRRARIKWTVRTIFSMGAKLS